MIAWLSTWSRERIAELRLFAVLSGLALLEVTGVMIATHGQHLTIRTVALSCPTAIAGTQRLKLLVDLAYMANLVPPAKAITLANRTQIDLSTLFAPAGIAV